MSLLEGIVHNNPQQVVKEQNQGIHSRGYTHYQTEAPRATYDLSGILQQTCPNGCTLYPPTNCTLKEEGTGITITCPGGSQQGGGSQQAVYQPGVTVTLTITQPQTITLQLKAAQQQATLTLEPERLQLTTQHLLQALQAACQSNDIPAEVPRALKQALQERLDPKDSQTLLPKAYTINGRPHTQPLEETEGKTTLYAWIELGEDLKEAFNNTLDEELIKRCMDNGVVVEDTRLADVDLVLTTLSREAALSYGTACGVATAVCNILTGNVLGAVLDTAFTCALPAIAIDRLGGDRAAILSFAIAGTGASLLVRGAGYLELRDVDELLDILDEGDIELVDEKGNPISGKARNALEGAREALTKNRLTQDDVKKIEEARKYVDMIRRGEFRVGKEETRKALAVAAAFNELGERYRVDRLKSLVDTVEKRKEKKAAENLYNTINNKCINQTLKECWKKLDPNTLADLYNAFNKWKGTNVEIKNIKERIDSKFVEIGELKYGNLNKNLREILRTLRPGLVESAERARELGRKVYQTLDSALSRFRFRTTSLLKDSKVKDALSFLCSPIGMAAGLYGVTRTVDPTPDYTITLQCPEGSHTQLTIKESAANLTLSCGVQ